MPIWQFNIKENVMTKKLEAAKSKKLLLAVKKAKANLVKAERSLKDYQKKLSAKVVKSKKPAAKKKSAHKSSRKIRKSHSAKKSRSIRLKHAA
jgi:hypothetical protein